MPIALDNSETVDVVLTLDKNKTPQPSFTSKYMTCREKMKYNKLILQARDEKDDEKIAELLIKAFAIPLVGWKNINKDFSIENIQDVLTTGEMWDLTYEISHTVMMDELTKKNLALQSQSNGEKDVATPPVSA